MIKKNGKNKSLSLQSMNKAEISILLPFYNAQTTLKRALESIRQQEYSHFECLMVDNNSSDSSSEIAREFQKTDPRFQLISEQKQGVVFASNTAYKMARAKYICRMDADDIMTPNRLLLQKKYLEENPKLDVVAGLVKYIPHHENTQGFKRYVKWVNSLLSYKDIYNNRFVESPIVNPSAMWRKEISDQYGMYKAGDFPEDYEMWLRWLSKDVRIQKFPEIVLHWQDSNTRLTRTHQIYNDKAFFKIKTAYLAKWLKKNNPHYPHVAVWGASRISRQRASLLLALGITIDSYIDIHKKRDLNTPILYYQDIPEAGKIFILCYIKEEIAKKKMMDYLDNKDYVLGENYMLIS
ncbi:MAG: glycosyl transferase family 2 [Bacteroidetes bacterium 4572_77]|nr:MAG: glycosyl transferase family 2 [Bacteroidetes bacterium 4572_77]